MLIMLPFSTYISGPSQMTACGTAGESLALQPNERHSSFRYTHRQLLNCRKDCGPAAWIFDIRSLLRHASKSTSIRACIRRATDCTLPWNADPTCRCSRPQSICGYLDAWSTISAIDCISNHIESVSPLILFQFTVLLPKFCTLHLSWTDRPTTPITVTLLPVTVVLPKSK